MGQVIMCLDVGAHSIQNCNECFICLAHCSMQLKAFNIVPLEVMGDCFHVDRGLFKYQRILDGLFLVKIPTEYHVNVSKVFRLHMFYAS